MEKKVFMMALSLIMLFGDWQNASAKKLVYLGHEYNGKVNDKNIPEGKGKIDNGGLIIEGIFDGKTINDAKFQTEWLSYNGTITYDREMKVILKQGGKLNKFYYKENEIQTSPAEASPSFHQPIIYLSSINGVKKKVATDNIDGDREVDILCILHHANNYNIRFSG